MPFLLRKPNCGQKPGAEWGLIDPLGGEDVKCMGVKNLAGGKLTPNPPHQLAQLFAPIDAWVMAPFKKALRPPMGKQSRHVAWNGQLPPNLFFAPKSLKTIATAPNFILPPKIPYSPLKTVAVYVHVPKGSGDGGVKSTQCLVCNFRVTTQRKTCVVTLKIREFVAIACPWSLWP